MHTCAGITVFAYMHICVSVFASQSTRWVVQSTTLCNECMLLRYYWVCTGYTCTDNQSVSVFAAPSTRSVMQSTTLFNRSVLFRYYYVTGITHAYLCRVGSLYSPCNVSSFASRIIISTQATLPNKARLFFFF